MWRCGEEEQVKRALLVLCDVQQPQKRKKEGIDPVGETDGSQNPVLAWVLTGTTIGL
jgi:hypothetical protein